MTGSDYAPSAATTSATSRRLDELRKLAIFADDAGFDVFATTEHHFDSEGYETSVAPLLLYADLAACKPSGSSSRRSDWCCPPGIPIRAAEELAVLDHLTKGARALTRGLPAAIRTAGSTCSGQQNHVTGAPMDGSAIDKHNRKVYEEAVKVIKKAWTEEVWDYDGEYYKVPLSLQGGHPALAGRGVDPRRTARPVRSTTRASSARSASCRSPTSSRTRRMFQPFSVSENDDPLHRAVRHRALDPRGQPARLPAPVRGPTRTRRPRPGGSSGLGESVGAFRAVHFGNTEAEAVKLLRDTNYAGFQNYFGGFGFCGGVSHAGGRRGVSTGAVHGAAGRRNGPSTACAR